MDSKKSYYCKATVAENLADAKNITALCMRNWSFFNHPDRNQENSEDKIKGINLLIDEGNNIIEDAGRLYLLPEHNFQKFRRGFDGSQSLYSQPTFSEELAEIKREQAEIKQQMEEDRRERERQREEYLREQERQREEDRRGQKRKIKVRFQEMEKRIDAMIDEKLKDLEKTLQQTHQNTSATQETTQALRVFKAPGGL